MVEYAVILAAVALIAAAVLYNTTDNEGSTTTGLQGAVQGAFNNAKDNVNNATKNSL